MGLAQDLEGWGAKGGRWESDAAAHRYAGDVRRARRAARLPVPVQGGGWNHYVPPKKRFGSRIFGKRAPTIVTVGTSSGGKYFRKGIYTGVGGAAVLGMVHHSVSRGSDTTSRPTGVYGPAGGMYQ